MLPLPPEPLSLTELVAAASAWVARLPPVADGRIAEEIDARAVRYHQSLGLVDRPLGYDGRHARYGHRHLHQIVVVRALQARGLSLAQVQAALQGTTDASLAAAAAEAVGTSRVAPEGPRPLVAFELAPGVTVVVDPTRNDPEAVRRALIHVTLPKERTP